MSTATTDSTQNLNLNPGAEAKASQKALDQAAKKKKAGMIAVIALGALGLYLIFDWYFFVTTDNAQIQANIAILTARSTGFVSKVNVEEGQKVKAGQVLVEIDAKDYKSRTSQSENELGSVAARVRDAELNYNRIQNLYVAGAVSLQQRDSAYANFQELSKKQKALKAQVELSESGLSDTQLRAPSDGTIAKKGAELGMLASTGTPLIGFVSDDSRWVVANFKETDLSRLHVGQPVEVEVDAISGRKFHGAIESFHPATGAVFSLLPPDNATGNFTKVVQRVPARIKLNDLTQDDIELLKAGLSAEISVKVH